MVIAMLLVLASWAHLYPSHWHCPCERAMVMARARAMPRAGSGPILRHLTKAIEPLALSSKEEALTVSKAQLVHCLNNQLSEFLAWYCCMVSLPS